MHTDTTHPPVPTRQVMSLRTALWRKDEELNELREEHDSEKERTLGLVREAMGKAKVR